MAPDDAAAVTALLPDADIRLRYGSDGLQHMYLGGEDVTESIRRPEISKYASSVSAIPAVRAFLLNMQRDLARTHDVIMDGREMCIRDRALPGGFAWLWLCQGIQGGKRAVGPPDSILV